MSRLEQLALLVALPLGVLVGIVDSRAEEVQPAVLLLALFGAGLGALAPRAPIAAGVVLGLGVPLVQGYMRLQHIALAYPTNGYAGTFLALIPAAAGALVGAALRRTLGAH